MSDAAKQMQDDLTHDLTREQHPEPPVRAGATANVNQAAATQANAQANSPAPAPVDPATLTTYNKDAFLKAVTDRTTALAIKLAAFNPAQAMADLGGRVDEFFGLVRNGKPYSALTRAQLNTLYQGLAFEHQKKLFEAQFNVRITGSGGASFTQDELRTLYAQARVLPPNQVEGNPSWATLLRANGVAEGSHGGSTITMGAQNNAARYSQVFRHEVGHAVDDRLGSRSSNLRLNEAGWHQYGTIDQWITALGGYGDIPATLQPVVRRAAQAYLGAGNTFDSPTPTFEATLLAQVRAAHPGVAQAPDGKDDVSKDLATLRNHYGTATLLKACIASQGRTNYWRFASWPEAGGKVFFINHYYAKPYSLSSATWTNLKSWNNSAAAFSDKEWFAEIYADWYQNGIGGAHTAFPDYVTNFFTTQVERLGTGATPAAAAPRPAVATAPAPDSAPAETVLPPLPGAELGAGGEHPKVPRG